MKLLIRDKKINILYANSFKLRFFGLMGKKKITYGIYFPNCNSIHTFFMKDEIDIIMLNKNNQILYLYENFKKNHILYKKEAKHLIELPKGFIKKYKIEINDYVKITN